MNIAVLCPSEIAYRRFMPSLSKIKELKFIGIGVNSVEERYENFNIPEKSVVNEMLEDEHNKAIKFISSYGGKLFNSYKELLNSDEVDIVYIPLPPALHFKWAKYALEHGKHVLVEKPATLSEKETRELIELANSKDLALHENYMFTFHNQLDYIKKIIKSGQLGEVRLYRISFGFPEREINDFRYNKALGGGALIDAGGYVLKYASMLLGKTANIKHACLNYIDKYDVDIYGCATLENSSKDCVQVSFGMDNNYKCDLEVWGSKGTLFTGRVLTAPVDFIPHATIIKNNVKEEIELPSDDTFYKSILHFLSCINDKSIRKETYKSIINQSILVDEFRKRSGNVNNEKD